MKGRESGMPVEEYWESFFDASCIVRKLDCGESRLGLVEFGCGYGQFTLPAARIAKGPVFALDIEPEMVTTTEQKARDEGLENVSVELRDFVEHGTGRPDSSVDYAMLFNILHIENPVRLLEEARRILVPGGKVGIIHWRSDIATPRGPSLEIRPKVEECWAWGEQAGLAIVRSEPLSCCSYHFGLVLERPT
jgi:ubiquinone/menaquinone biosynthesis C-methylase UbiE